MYSANDAAYISALAVSENIDDFLILMNKKAKSIKMDNTNYTNPDGIDNSNHYTTFIDLLKLSIEVSKNIKFGSWVFIFEAKMQIKKNIVKTINPKKPCGLCNVFFKNFICLI